MSSKIFRMFVEKVLVGWISGFMIISFNVLYIFNSCTCIVIDVY